MNYDENFMAIRTFVLNPMHEMQFSKKIFGDSDKKRIFAATNPTTPLNDAYHGGTSLLYGYM